MGGVHPGFLALNLAQQKKTTKAVRRRRGSLLANRAARFVCSERARVGKRNSRRRSFLRPISVGERGERCVLE